MNDELRDRIKAGFEGSIEPAAPGLADRAFGAIVTGALVAPTIPGTLHAIGGWVGRHWPWVGGGATVVAIAGIVLAAQPPAVGVYVGYADSRPVAAGAPAAFPNPWAGSPNTDFVGVGPTWDAGAVRIDNRTGAELVISRVAVDIGPHHYELWGSNLRLGGHRTLVLTQTRVVQPNPLSTDFDTSEIAGDRCTGGSQEVPVVHLVISGHQVDFEDRSLVLTTGGHDLGNCPGSPTESHPWRELPHS